MELTRDDLKVIREFNNNVRWLRQKELKEEYSASAGDIMAVTGWSKERLRGERERGSIRSKKCGIRYRYDMSSLPEVFKQKVIHSSVLKAS